MGYCKPVLFLKKVIFKPIKSEGFNKYLVSDRLYREVHTYKSDFLRKSKENRHPKFKPIESDRFKQRHHLREFF